LQINPFETLGRVITILMAADVYKNEPLFKISSRLIHALGNNKLRVYGSGSCLEGFITWAYFTDEEVKTGKFKWEEAFARDDGDQLWIVDMAATDGVLYLCKDFRRYISETTNHKIAYWRRSRNGRRLGKAWRLK